VKYLHTIVICAILGSFLAGCVNVTEEYKPLYQVKPEKEKVE
jgi:hypothetical protein